MPDFMMQQQQEDEWCWAAVAVSIHQFLDPAKAGEWTQETLATAMLQKLGAIPPGIDCSERPDLCNMPAGLDTALSTAGNLSAPGCLQGKNLPFEILRVWIDDKLPVCARIVWDDGGAHFIALDGYRVFSSGAQQVHVQDPLFGPSFQLYDDLLSDYPPGGSWQDTYLVKK
jgi:hypothetical protein